MFLRTWTRSWEFAKLSYSTLLDHKHLIALPVISSLATLLVLASFLLPLEMTGQLDTWLASIDGEASGAGDPTMYVTAFLFYFCNYFCIVFFNTALIASVMDIFEGGLGRLSFGLKFALKRIHAIFGWALVSACVGMFGFLLMLPVIGIGIALGIYVSVPAAIAISAPLGILAVLFSTTADAIFKAYLYSFATGKTLPGNVHTDAMRDAFSAS